MLTVTLILNSNEFFAHTQFCNAQTAFTAIYHDGTPHLSGDYHKIIYIPIVTLRKDLQITQNDNDSTLNVLCLQVAAQTLLLLAMTHWQKTTYSPTENVTYMKYDQLGWTLIYGIKMAHSNIEFSS